MQTEPFSRARLCSSIAALALAIGCGSARGSARSHGEGGESSQAGASGGSAVGGSTSFAGVGGTGMGTAGSSAAGTAAGGIGASGTGAGGMAAGGMAAGGTGAGGIGAFDPNGLCARWKARGPGALPGFATDSACADFTNIPTGDVPCSGATNGSAVIAEVLMGQTHLGAPTSENYVTNEAKTFKLTNDAIRPKFRLVSHRPALLKVGVTGAGGAPQVKVTATRGGAALGSLCLKGPPSLPGAISRTPNFEDSFTVQLPPAWIRPGLALQIEAGNAKRAIPTSELRVAGGIRYTVVEVSALLYGNRTPIRVPMYMPRMADELPVQSLIWSHFPVPISFDPLVVSGANGKPDRVMTVPEFGPTEVGACLGWATKLRAANGQSDDTIYFVGLDHRWGYGLAATFVGAAGEPSQQMIRHETGHTYGLPHVWDAYQAHQYPFALRTDGTGCVGNFGVCGVGPEWKYFQHFGAEPSVDEPAAFASPWDPSTPDGAVGGTPGTYRLDPMTYVIGDSWFGAYDVQWILENLQTRAHWDDQRGVYVRYDAASGELVPDGHVNGYYDRPSQRDVPVYTLFGSASATVPAARVIQPPLHYRGNLLETLNPSNDADLAAAATVCKAGCNFTVRVTFDGSKTRSVLIKDDDGAAGYIDWAINVPDEGTVTKVELFKRPFNGTGAMAATFLDSATLLVSRTF